MTLYDYFPKGLLNDMITEEEALKLRIRANIITFKKQLDTLCLEMSMDPYKVSGYFFRLGL